MTSPPLPRFWRRANIATLALIFVTCLGIGSFLAIYERVRANLPSIGRLENWRPNLVTTVYSADGKVIAEFASERREIVPLDQVPHEFIEAILATEDRSFYRHKGIHLRRVFGAAWYNFVTRSPTASGASTITMQLSRSLFLTPEKRFVRKFKEMVLAIEIERRYSKDRILEMYVNQVYFGSGAYGIESAAQLYFGKPATELTLPEAALLAGIVQSPSRQSPRVNMEAALARRAIVLTNLERVGAVTPAQARRARQTPIELAPPRQRAGPDSYFAEHVRRQLEQMLGSEAVWRGGYRVYTTLDTRLQEVAERTLEEHLREIEKTLSPSKIRREQWLAERDTTAEEGAEPIDVTLITPYLQGILVAMDLDTGGLIAMVGGRSFEESKFNRATQGLRQPGSVFKPFVYTAAIRNGFPASYVVQDQPFSMETGDGEIWEPVNYDGKFRGPVNLRHALTNSINVPTVRLLFDVGVQAVVDYARDAGITTDLPPFGSLALGAADVIPIEILQAYTVFPTGGQRVTPISITRIEDWNGNLIGSFEASRTRVLRPQEAHIMRTILQDVVNHGTGRYGVRGRGFEWPAGGKTGTTNESTDAWFVGFTPEYIALTWVGFDLKQRIRFNGTGGLLAAPIWGDFMIAAHEGLEPPEEAFADPGGLKRINVTRTTGMLAAEFCGMESYSEIVLPGTEPDHYCYPPREPTVPLDGSPPDETAESDEPDRVGDDFLF